LRRYVSDPASGYFNNSLNFARTMTEKSTVRWTVDNEKTKGDNTRNDSDASGEPLRAARDLEAGWIPGLEIPDWQLPNIAHLSVLRLPDVETPKNEAAMIYHTERIHVPVVMDFSLAYPHATRAKL
jgi:hypothetical protein